jgi:integrase
VVAVHCGLRQGELLGLKWEDVDLEARTLRVRRTLSKGEFAAPKTAKGRRSVSLTPPHRRGKPSSATASGRPRRWSRRARCTGIGAWCSPRWWARP